jgi:hypothetical protein
MEAGSSLEPFQSPPTLKVVVVAAKAKLVGRVPLQKENAKKVVPTPLEIQISEAEMEQLGLQGQILR